MTGPASVDGRAGLCGTCLHARVITSDRGTTFVRCARHDTDPRFPKYPMLPVLRCPGYAPDQERC